MKLPPSIPSNVNIWKWPMLPVMMPADHARTWPRKPLVFSSDSVPTTGPRLWGKEKLGPLWVLEAMFPGVRSAGFGVRSSHQQVHSIEEVSMVGTWVASHMRLKSDAPKALWITDEEAMLPSSICDYHFNSWTGNHHESICLSGMDFQEVLVLCEASVSKRSIG